MRCKELLVKTFYIGVICINILSLNNISTKAVTLEEVFDTKAYADTYSDVKVVCGYDADALLEHYFTYGVNENRVMHGMLDLKGYRYSNPDLNVAFGDDWRAYAEHYINYGITEGRGITNDVQVGQNSDYRDIVFNDGTVSSNYFNSVMGYWDKIPTSIKASMKADDWRVKVTSNKLHLDGISLPIKAITYYERGEIVISTRGAASILHETGHYLDYKKGFCSSSLPDDVYQSEKENAMKVGAGSHINNYNTKLEYFAECVGLYLNKPSEFKRMCPGTSAYIEAHML